MSRFFFNDRKQLVNDAIEGILLSAPHAHLVKLDIDPAIRVVARGDWDKSRVAVISGGGSGHEPAHAGFVGKGMLSAAVAGQVFTSPTPDQILEGIKAADEGQGVFLVIKNYTGDVMNFDMAKELAELEDIEVDSIVVDDDIAVEDSTFTAGRRGVAGTVFMHKILGAAAESGASLKDIKALAEQVNDNLYSIGLALSPATNPEVGKPGFELEDNEIEFGIGIHGEPGYSRENLKPSKELAEEFVSKLKKEVDWSAGDKFAVMVNGMGATPLMEQFVFMNDIRALLDDGEELDLVYRKVGDYMTAIDMAGVSLTLLKIEDVQWIDYLNAPVEVIGW